MHPSGGKLGKRLTTQKLNTGHNHKHRDKHSQRPAKPWQRLRQNKRYERHRQNRVQQRSLVAQPRRQRPATGPGGIRTTSEQGDGHNHDSEQHKR
jgi:hypothetical protein